MGKIAYILKVKGVEEIRHVLSAPVGQLVRSNVVVPLGGQEFLYRYWLMAEIVFFSSLSSGLTEELKDRRVIAALREDFSATSERRDNQQRDSDACAVPPLVQVYRFSNMGRGIRAHQGQKRYIQALHTDPRTIHREFREAKPEGRQHHPNRQPLSTQS